MLHNDYIKAGNLCQYPFAVLCKAFLLFAALWVGMTYSTALGSPNTIQFVPGNTLWDSVIGLDSSARGDNLCHDRQGDLFGCFCADI